DRVAEIDRPRDVVRRRHQADEALDEIVDIAEGAGLRAVAIDGDRLALERLNDEVRHDTAIIGVHARPVGIEDARHADPELVLPVIIEEQRLRAALALVIAGARPDRVDVAAVVLALRMDDGIAIDLGGRRLEDLGAHALGKSQHVDRAADAGLGRLDRVELVVDGRGRASEIVDLVDLDIEREADIVAHRLEIRVRQQMRDVGLAPGEVIVDAEYVVAPGQQALAEMRAEEAGAAGDEDAFFAGAHGAFLWRCLALRPDALLGVRGLDGTAADAEVIEAGFGHVGRLVDVAQVDDGG